MTHYIGFRKSLAGKSLAFVLNFLVLPGLGNITLGKYIAGSLQLFLTLLGLFLMGSSGYESIKNLQISQSGHIMELADYSHFLIYALSGLIVGAAGFIWATITYFSVIKYKLSEPPPLP